MKLKKQDIGLYLAASLAGGGVGLLVGALIASRLTEPITIPEETWDEQVERIQKLDDPPEKIAGEKKPRKKTMKLKAQDDPELAAFIAEWEPSTIQIEMLRNEQATMADVEAIILEERMVEESEPYNYSAPYYDKPELSELVSLVEDEEIVDDRYQILEDPPSGKSKKSVRVFLYDAQDESFSKRARNGRPVPTTLPKTMDETWITLRPYFDRGHDVLYVDDLETTKWFRFELIPDDLEDSSDNGNDPRG